jgi:hypothetical protein
MGHSIISLLSHQLESSFPLTILSVDRELLYLARDISLYLEGLISLNNISHGDRVYPLILIEQYLRLIE